MPIAYALHRTPAGREVLKMVSTGEVTGAHAQDFQVRTLPGGEYAGRALLIVVERTTAVSTEARKVFTAPSPPEQPRPSAAIVTPNPTLRVLLNFMTRVSGGEANTRFFSTEAEAEGWLDTQPATVGGASTAGGSHA